MSAKMHIRLDEVTITKYHWRGPQKVGTFGWDSSTGEVWGTLADAVKVEARRAKRRGSTNTIHPIPGGFHVRITNPLHDPGELAVILESLGFNISDALEPFFEQKIRRQRRAQEKFDREARTRGEEIVY
jgi:hypothetical protein